MSVSYDPDELPPETVEVNSRVWEREKFDSDSYQWMREMDEDEYDWDKDKVDIVGGGEPIRMVTLQLMDGKCGIQGSETAGSDYHRPGFCELISSEFAASAETVEEAHDKVMDIIERLS
jgi:hypothetical protein